MSELRRIIPILRFLQSFHLRTIMQRLKYLCQGLNYPFNLAACISVSISSSDRKPLASASERISFNAIKAFSLFINLTVLSNPLLTFGILNIIAIGSPLFIMASSFSSSNLFKTNVYMNVKKVQPYSKKS